MFNNLLLVGLGGGLGSILRYLVQRNVNGIYPYGTFLVNVAGCLLIGMLWGLTLKGFDEQKRLLLATGFCGGFTTFSAFSQESIQMISESRWLSFAIYTGGSIIAGLLATIIGFKMMN